MSETSTIELNSEPTIATDLIGESAPVEQPTIPLTGAPTLPAGEPEIGTGESTLNLGTGESTLNLGDSAPSEAPGSTPMPEQALVCNCGKVPGSKGPHKLTCPLRGKYRSGASTGTPATAGTASTIGVSSIGEIATEKPPVDFDALAGVLFDLTTNTAAVAIGPEWKSESDDEKKLVCGPLANYLRVQEVKDVPPGLLLCFVIGAYSAKRVTHPNTKTKLINAYLWIKPKVSGFFSGIINLFRRNRSGLKVAS